jgi:predicted PurR-regulated permease PerM
VKDNARTAADDARPVTASHDLTRTVLMVLLIMGLMASSLWLLGPFIPSLAWATMIVVATWPLMLKVHVVLRRRALAVAVMSGAMVLVFVVPLLLAIQTLAANTDTIVGWVRSLDVSKIPPPPEWLYRIPLAGAKLAEYWSNITTLGKEEIVARLAPYAGAAAQWLALAFGSVGLVVVQFLLTVVITVIMYSGGEAMRDGLLRFGQRLGGDRGRAVVVLAGQSIRAVALGVVVTALAQTVLAGLGLAVAGVPFAGLLTGVILILCIAQIGPVVVLVGAVIWLYWNDAVGWATALLVWTVGVGALDNVLRPILIRKGADVPLLLIFAGVIGGLLALGIIGLFIGPVVLAVSYTLLKDWMASPA